MSKLISVLAISCVLATAGASPAASQAQRSNQKSMQNTDQNFSMQYLGLQTQMGNQNRNYTAVSNVMKTKHSTVKNAIKNVR